MSFNKQKVTFDWVHFGLERTAVGVIAFLINSAFEMIEVANLSTGGVHLLDCYQKTKRSY